MRKLISSLILCGAIAATSNVYAMHLNITLASDIVANQDGISFDYTIYEKEGVNNHFSISNLSQAHFSTLVEELNEGWTSVTPVDGPHGEHSSFSFGYVKNGTHVSPPSCQNILAKAQTTVVLSEAGCLVK